MAITLKLYKHRVSKNKLIDGKWFSRTKKMQEVDLDEISWWPTVFLKTRKSNCLIWNEKI